MKSVSEEKLDNSSDADGTADARADGGKNDPEQSAQDQQSPFQLHFAQGRMAILLDCDVPEGDVASFCRNILNQLLKMKVADPPRIEELVELVTAASKGVKHLEGIRVVEGKPMIPSQDARLEWAEDFFKTGFETDEKTGAVDYRQKASRLIVTEGKLLARITPAVAGTDGVDVLGKRVPSPKPRRPRVRVGGNVLHDSDSDQFTAESAGRLRWMNDVLSVDKVFVIEGSIGLKSGNITHPGALVVKHDILEGTKVQADGDIEVRGVIEPADIKAGGRLIVHGGITGSDETSIVVTGGVQAKFLLDVDIQAGEHIVIEKEILQSKVRTRGCVSVKKGRIIGGEISALGGVEAAEVGSEAVVPTFIEAGNDFKFMERYKPKHDEQEQLRQKISQIHLAVNPIMPKLDALPKAKQDAIHKLIDSAKEMEERVKVLEEEIEGLRAESADRAQHLVLVKKVLFPETTICLHGEKLIVKSQHEGPLKAVYVKGRIKLRSDQVKNSLKLVRQAKKTPEGDLEQEDEAEEDDMGTKGHQ